MARTPDPDDGDTGEPTPNESAESEEKDNPTRRVDMLGGNNDRPTDGEDTATGEKDVATDEKDAATGGESAPSAASDDDSLLVDRREVMRIVGGTAAAVSGLGALTGSGAAAEYETVTVEAGGSYTEDLGSGDTLENVLIDVSADGADVHISASGSGWTIRNIGIRGTIDVGDDSPGGDSAQYEGGFGQVFDTQVTDSNGSALMENIYLGEGIAAGVDKTCMNVSTSHEGEMTVRNVNVGGFSTTCFYISGFGRENTGGTMTIEDSYFENSSSAHIRPAGDVTIRNCTITNTNEVVYLPRTFGGLEQAITSRGIWTSYNGSPTRVENCDIDVREGNTCDPPWSYSGPCQANAVWASDAAVDLVDCEVRGSVGGNVSQSGVGSNPDTSLPSGCPDSAEAAASGGSGSGGAGSGDSGSGGSGNPDGGQTDSELTVSGGSPSDLVTYSFEVSDAVDHAGSANDEDSVSGAAAAGAVAGGSDSYRYTGEVTDFSATDAVTVTIDGQTVDPATLASDGSYIDEEEDSGSDDGSDDDSDETPEEEPELSRTLSVSGGSPSNLVDYTFDVSEAVDHETTANEEDSISGVTASGAVAGGTDDYVFAGEVTSFDAASAVTLTVDGETVDPASIGDGSSDDGEDGNDDAGDDTDDGSDGDDSDEEEPELSRTLSVSGGSPSNLVGYAFDVSEAVDHETTANEEDSVSGTSATGAVAGGTDDYVFAGDVTSFEVEGDVTLTVDGETVDPASIGDGSSDDGEDGNDDSGDDTSDGSDGDDSDGDDQDESPELPNVINVAGGGLFDGVDYSFTASEAVGDAGRINPEDSISGRTASGTVAGHVDRYAFAGEITSFDADGDVTVTINGDRVDPSSL